MSDELVEIIWTGRFLTVPSDWSVKNLLSLLESKVEEVWVLLIDPTGWYVYRSQELIALLRAGSAEALVGHLLDSQDQSSPCKERRASAPRPLADGGDLAASRYRFVEVGANGSARAIGFYDWPPAPKFPSEELKWIGEPLESPTEQWKLPGDTFGGESTTEERKWLVEREVPDGAHPAGVELRHTLSGGVLSTSSSNPSSANRPLQRGFSAAPDVLKPLMPSKATRPMRAPVGSVAPAAAPREDEGSTPQRFPSIEADREPAAGAHVTFTVDLLWERSVHTAAAALALGELEADWQEVELDVVLECAHLAFDSDGRGRATIRRNQDSVPAKIGATVRADFAPGTPLVVLATFFHGTRYCGNALRTWMPVSELAMPAMAATQGTVVVEPKAAQPDVSIYIRQIGEKEKGGLHWQIVTARFPGLPAQLSGQIELGRDTAQQAQALFGDFATLERGKHVANIEGFGAQLWRLAPDAWRNTYWALSDHYQRELTIQFITDEPHIPWELMQPERDDPDGLLKRDGRDTFHKPLALRHAVGRWISRWDGYMRNQLPDGQLVTIAPEYRTANRQLPRAQLESKELIDKFAAQRIGGTYQEVMTLLETSPPPQAVSILHFAGHGEFKADMASQSRIALQDKTLSALEVNRPQIRLGHDCRTLVFLNACEVGSAGAVFGEMGGWADVLLGRGFGGFIAPLWSVDDEDAGEVAIELLKGIYVERKTIGAVLRDIRFRFGDRSPTFYSYLYYGDVTARLAPRVP